MSGVSELGADKQTTEASLNAFHQRLRAYTVDKITILDDMISTIESFYKSEKHGHEKMKGTLQKSLDHVHNMTCLGSSVIGSAWATAVKELMEHYVEREAQYPVLKHVVLENLRKIKTEKIDEYNKILLYNEEIIKEVVDIERRVMKAKRAHDDAYERPRQKESGIKRLHQKILPRTELDIEGAVADARNVYVVQVQLMNFALKFYVEQFLVDLDKLLVCDLFSRVEEIIEALTYTEYKRLHDALQRALRAAIEDGNEQNRRLLPKTFQNYPLLLPTDQSDQISTDERSIPQLASVYIVATNDAREADQQIKVALESSVLNAQQNKDSRIDSGKIRLKRMEMRKSTAVFVMEMLEKLVPNIKTTATSPRGSKAMGGLKPIVAIPKSEINSVNSSSATGDVSTSPPSVDLNTGETPQAPSSSTYPCQGIVLYDFESANEDELSIRKDEKILIQAKFESGGWLVAKSRDGIGLVPQSYVELIPVLQQTSSESESTKNAHPDRDNKNKKKSKNKKETSNASMADPSTSINADEADDFSDN